MEKLHIGERIKERAKELRIGATELGKLINTSKQNIYGIYKRRTIDTGLLKNISEALGYDFFQFYANDEFTMVSSSELGDIETLYKDVEQIKSEIQELKAKYKLIKKGNR